VPDTEATNLGSPRNINHIKSGIEMMKEQEISFIDYQIK
jgi:hypothetical protein